MIKKIYIVLPFLILLPACEKNVEEDHKVVSEDCSQVEAYYSESVFQHSREITWSDWYDTKTQSKILKNRLRRRFARLTGKYF